jgi:dephospho-CoA kinase
MRRVALTGGIGSGKTTVSAMFLTLGIPVFNADIEAKKCYDNAAIRDGKPDMTALAKIVFNDKEALHKINSLIHPLVLQKYEYWCGKHTDIPYTLIESAVIFEAGLADHFDCIINVHAAEDIRMERIMKRDNFSREEMEQRLRSQMDPQEKKERSDFVIYNDGTQLVIPQILAIHEKLANF